MRLVERAEPAHPLVAQQRLHDVLADGRGGAPGAVVVGGAADRDPQSPVGVRAEKCVGHLDTHSALLSLRPLRRALGHRPVGRPVHVQVVREHELGAYRGRAGEDGVGHRAEQLGPLRVGRLCAVVDDGRALARVPSAFGSADVGRHLLDTLRHIPLARARDGAHPQVPARELAHDRRARAAPGSDYDVIAGHVHRGD
jgi:hypothetical protein